MVMVLLEELLHLSNLMEKEKVRSLVEIRLLLHNQNQHQELLHRQYRIFVPTAELRLVGQNFVVRVVVVWFKNENQNQIFNQKIYLFSLE
jgi:predicted cation transporter